MAGKGRLGCRNFVLLIVAAISFTGCSPHDMDWAKDSSIGETAALADLTGQRPSDDDLLNARRHFAAGDYGMSERYFRKAVEANPHSTGAWVGLAASYDQLSRFDLAERVYDKMMKIHGRKTPWLLNNYGYHYLLQGNKNKAKKIFLEAAELDPDDPKIQINLRLVDEWSEDPQPNTLVAHRH